MKKLLPFSLLIFFSIHSPAQNFSVSQKLDSALSYLNKTNRFNGAVLYAEHGKILYKKVFGVTDFRTNQQLKTTSAFNLASISKQFICMGIMMLSEKGKLNYDDPVKKYLPEIPYDSITIRNLMTHTSGIPEYFELYQQYRESLDTLTNEKMIALFARLKPSLDFSTGTKWMYSNTNYVYLASIIERITQQPLSQFFYEQIARPLQLNDTYIYNVTMPVSPANRVYGFEQENGKQKINDLTVFDGVVGDGNVYSSVEDLYKWEQSLYTEKLVKRSTLSEAFKPVNLNDGTTYPYGFGWFIEKENEAYRHTGSWTGFYNLIYRDVKQQRTIILLSSNTDTIARYIARAVFEGRQYNIPAMQLIKNVKVIDGTGTPARSASVRIEGNRIKEIGDLKPLGGEAIIDGMGKVLAPGFIDSHSHHDRSLQKKPEALAAVSQGITTIVAGQDGSSLFIDEIKTALKHKPIAVNMATYTGHTTLRKKIMGVAELNRPATQEELEKMKVILRDELKKGSLGLSTGLEYEAAFFSNRDEVLQLAKVTAEENGKYISHIRSEDVMEDDALEEIIMIGRQAKLPVQVSHIKIALKDGWGSASNLLAKLDAARAEGINITADCYPYDYWSSTLKVLFPKRDYTNIESAEFAVNHLFDPSESVLVNFSADPNYKGKTISAIAGLRKETPAQTLISLIAAADEFEKKHPESNEITESITGKSMGDADVINFLTWPNTNICSDGADGGHPRGYGSFTRVLARYVREKKVISLESAIYKMTALTAEHVGLTKRGIIAPGYFADLVLFDPETVQDNATIQNSKALSSGIIKVWVNGECVYRNKQTTQKFPGKFLSR